MSVQKKSLISQRSAVKSAMLATPQNSRISLPAVRPAARPAVKGRSSAGSREASDGRQAVRANQFAQACEAQGQAGR